MRKGSDFGFIGAGAAFIGGILLVIVHHSSLVDTHWIHGSLDLLAIGLVTIPVWMSC